MRSQWKFYFECMLDIFKIAGNPGEQKCDWCYLSIIHFWLWHFGKILDEILLEVKAKLMLFEGVGLIFTRGCATFYKLSMNFIIYKILCSFATNTKWSLGKKRFATFIFLAKLYSYWSHLIFVIVLFVPHFKHFVAERFFLYNLVLLQQYFCRPQRKNVW